ncbi:hypothetical protein D3C85_1453270 [compost metagenome]
MINFAAVEGRPNLCFQCDLRFCPHDRIQPTHRGTLQLLARREAKEFVQAQIGLHNHATLHQRDTTRRRRDDRLLLLVRFTQTALVRFALGEIANRNTQAFTAILPCWQQA